MHDRVWPKKEKKKILERSGEEGPSACVGFAAIQGPNARQQSAAFQSH